MFYINQLFDFFLPRFCPCCKSKLKPDEFFICSNCKDKINTVSDEFVKSEFDRKFSNDGFITDFSSLFIFEDGKEFQKMIHSVKYDGNFRLGIFIGKVIAERLRDRIINWQADLIIPIPLHHRKKAERGFNQSLYLAKGISASTGITIKKNAVIRARFTSSQTKLNLVERKNNIEGAFKVTNPKIIEDKKIILVDDVITTGATISECANCLLNAGASKIFALSSAIAAI